MTKKDIEGFLSNPFFAALRTQKDEPDLEWFKDVFEDAFKNDSNDRMYLYDSILRKYYEINGNLSSLGERQFNANYLIFVEQAVLEYFVQEEVLHYFCLSQEYDKVIGLINRKQTSSKLLILILSRISRIVEALRPNIERLTLILSNDIKRRVVTFNNDYVMKEMGQFKSKIDSITSGVNIKCYLEFHKPGLYYSTKPSDDLLSYVKEKHGYDLMRDDSSWLEGHKHLKELLSIALLDDEKLWSFDRFNEKTIVDFVALVEKYNDIKHAEKIIDYAFEEACKNPIIKVLYDNKLPLALYNIEETLINWSLNRLDVYLSKVVDFKIEKSELKGFIYPFYKGYDEYITLGKEVFINFIKDVYPKDYERVLSDFYNLNYIIQEEKNTLGKTRKALTIRDILDYHVLGYDKVEEKKKYLSLGIKDFFNDESVLGRLYYRIYIIDKYAKELSFECIYEYLYEVLKVIEKNTKLKSSYVLNTQLRDTNYSLLKEILLKYNLSVDDKYKHLYINALLDRKYATAEEASRFAELEQFGDAIYELAVDNIASK